MNGRKLALKSNEPCGQRRSRAASFAKVEQRDAELLGFVGEVDRTARNYLRQIQGVIQTLCEVENRSPDEIIRAIREIGFDVVRSRIPDTMVYDDSIHLEVAANYTGQIRSLLTVTATTEIQPEPYFLRVLKKAVTYANQRNVSTTLTQVFA